MAGPRFRKLLLTVHIAVSVGWLGAVATFLALAVVALTSDNDQTVRGAYLLMERAAWLALVPLALASLVTGVLQSLTTKWGLFRHYWVVFKLLINVFSTTVLLLYMQTFSAMAAVAADPDAELADVRTASPALHAGAALVLLLVATVLAVYKPPGLTPFAGRDR